MQVVTQKKEDDLSVRIETSKKQGLKTVLEFRNKDRLLLKCTMAIDGKRVKFSAAQSGVTIDDITVVGTAELGSSPQFSALTVNGLPVGAMPRPMDNPVSESVIRKMAGADKRKWRSSPDLKLTVNSLQKLQDLMATGFQEDNIQTLHGSGDREFLKKYMLSLGCMAGCLAAYTLALAGSVATIPVEGPVLPITISFALVAYMACLLGCQFAFAVDFLA